MKKISINASLVLVSLTVALGFLVREFLLNRDQYPLLSQLFISSSCSYNDRTFCRYINTSPTLHHYKETSVIRYQDRGPYVSIYKIDGKNRLALYTATNNQETSDGIVIGTTSYSRLKDGTWYKGYTDELKQNSTKAKSSGTKLNALTSLKPLGQEVCGDLLCYKFSYQSTGSNVAYTVWFDTKTYRTRRIFTNLEAGGEYEIVFDYSDYAVRAPTNLYVGTAEIKVSPLPTGSINGVVPGNSFGDDPSAIMVVPGSSSPNDPAQLETHEGKSPGF